MARGVKFTLDAHKVLLVIAHPDDECMFFAPTLSVLTRQHVQVFVLCLSNGEFASNPHLSAPLSLRIFHAVGSHTYHSHTAGNAEGLGAVREKELLAACTVLRVS